MIQILVLTSMLLLTACASAPQSNAEKCKAAGGTYNARTNSCQFQSELPKKK